MSSSLRAADFVGSFGVNVHLQYLNTAAKTGSTLAALNYLGVASVRSPLAGALLANNSITAKLAEAGIHFDMLLTAGVAPAVSIANAAKFAAAHPGSIVSIEGPNEIDHWPVTFNGLTGLAGGIAFVNAAAQAARANAALTGVDIFDLTGAARSAPLSQDLAGFANIHAYPGAGNQPHAALLRAVSHQSTLGKGTVITEAGYTNALGNPNLEGVDQTTQAKLTLNLLADATKLGVAKTFLYQLNDDLDPTGTSVDKNLGLFDAKFQPKHAATAIHNLTTILADPAPRRTDLPRMISATASPAYRRAGARYCSKSRAACST